MTTDTAPPLSYRRPTERYDVVVAGGGNAGLCAAMQAAGRGARVLLIERAGEADRGGNSKYTRNIRVAGRAHGGYDPDEFLADLAAVSGEGFERDLAELVIRSSEDVPEWMESKGIAWQPAFRGTLHLSRTNRFFLGGGKALVNTYYRRAEADGVEIRYGTLARHIRLEAGRFRSVELLAADHAETVEAGALIIASGGFESNLEWLGRYWGEAAANFSIRGTPHNDGRLLAELLELGAVARGNERGFHAVAVDARSPRYDGGIVTRIDSIPFGIAVNRDGRRFYDEGEDLWPKRYATWGRLIAEQPGQQAWSLFDSKVVGRFIPGVYPALSAPTVSELAAALGLEPVAVVATVEAFNRAVDGVGDFDPTRLDGRRTAGLEPAKSNWAQALDTPPYYAYPLRPGITFTYLAVGVDSQARVLLGAQGPVPNLFAAGEVMAGNVLRRGYLGGVGLTIGTVFGRIAGEGAASYANAA